MPARPQIIRVETEAQHRTQVIIECWSVFSTFLFIVGSFCFFDWGSENVTIAGDLLFIAASFIYVGVSSHTMWEWGYYGKDHWGIIGRTHFFEALAYLVAAVIFALGCVFFWPGIYGEGHETIAFYGEEFAAWCFIIGSLGFVVGSWFSALNISKDTYSELPGGKMLHSLAAWALLCGLIGGVAFVTGSWLYRPDISKTCEDAKADPEADEGAEIMCTESIWSGTLLYCIGSCLYFTQSVLNVIKLQVRYHEDQKANNAKAAPLLA